MVCGVDQQGGVFVFGEIEVGVVEDFVQCMEGFEMCLDIGFYQCEQVLGQFDGFDLNFGVFEFGLF